MATNHQHQATTLSTVHPVAQRTCRANEYFDEPEHVEHTEFSPIDPWELITPEQAEKELQYCDSFSRLPAMLEMEPFMESDYWLNLLGDKWSTCDNIGLFIDELLDSPMGWGFESSSEMMNTDEREELIALPDVVTIYRGCYQINKHGLSWSLSKEVATKFPLLNRYWRPTEQPYLITAKVNKVDIIALKNSRGESEIITYRPKHFSTRRLEQRPKGEPFKGVSIAELVSRMESETSGSAPISGANRRSRA